MKKRIDIKYFVLVVLLMFGGEKISAQVSSREDDEQEIRNDSVRNKSQTLTHTMPFNYDNARFRQKNPSVKFAHVDDALNINFKSFANAIGNDARCVFAPVVVIKPFVRFNDKMTVGVISTQMLQNYTEKTMKPVIFDMYAYATLKTKQSDISIKVGKFSMLNYSAEFSNYMPISNFFINEISLQSGAFFPRAIVVGIDDDEMACSLGYMEKGSGFKFDDVDGYAVCLMEIKVEDYFKTGCLIQTNNKSANINIHFASHLTSQSDLLLQFLNIGSQFAVHGTYVYKLRDDKAAFSINGFYQSDDGVAGCNINLRHNTTGGYASFGATYHDPLHKNMPDGTDNERWNKLTPFIEIGVSKTLFPQKTR